MNKTVIVVVVVVLGGLLLPISNLVAGHPTGTALTKTPPADAELAGVLTALEGGCAWCHVRDVPRPFYAAIPPASSIVAADVEAGLGEMDLVTALLPGGQAPVDEVTLAKLEHEVASGAMPPFAFTAMHWNGGLAGPDHDKLLAWIKRTRAARAGREDLPPALQSAVIRPLPPKVAVDEKRAALGNKLYHDVRLSVDDTLSCASCHDLKKGGTDQARVSKGVRAQMGGINAPTTFNAGLQFTQFWDGRAATLEDQAAGPPANPIEMGTTWEDIVVKLGQDAPFTSEFTAVFPDGWSKATITAAIAEFERTLVTPGSRFDRYLLGDANALDAQERKGYATFLSLGCAKCHVGELLGGRSFERMGRRADYFADRGAPTEADNGRYNVTKGGADRHAFKVPTLRNVALTFPYFHDGSRKDLRTAVISMAHFQLGTLLTESESGPLVKFLGSLTGEYQGKAL